MEKTNVDAKSLLSTGSHQKNACLKHTSFLSLENHEEHIKVIKRQSYLHKIYFTKKL